MKNDKNTEHPYRMPGHAEYRYESNKQRLFGEQTLEEIRHKRAEERKERRKNLSWRTYRFDDWAVETIIFLLLVFCLALGFGGWTVGEFFSSL